MSSFCDFMGLFSQDLEQNGEKFLSQFLNKWVCFSAPPTQNTIKDMTDGTQSYLCPYCARLGCIHSIHMQTLLYLVYKKPKTKTKVATSETSIETPVIQEKQVLFSMSGFKVTKNVVFLVHLFVHALHTTRNFF